MFRYMALILFIALIANWKNSKEVVQEYCDFWIKRNPIKKASLLDIYSASLSVQTLIPVHIYGSLLIAVFASVLSPNSVGWSTNPSEYGPLAIILAIFLEELLFRYPWMIMNFVLNIVTKRNYDHAFGFATAIVFGLMHLDNYKSFELIQLLLVMSQVFGGTILWYIAKKNGFIWSFVFHLMFNMLLFSI